MAGITKMVDERIELMRKERAELDSFKEELERREAALKQQEESWEAGNTSYLEEKKAAIRQEIEEATNELERLRTERNQSLTTFGAEIEQIHAKRVEENEEILKQLEQEINSLAAAKEEMKQKRNEIERELTSFEQQKELQWEKAKAEIASYKAAQMADISAKKEQILAEAEEEGIALLEGFKEVKSERIAQFAEQEKQHERNLKELLLKKQAINDDIEMLQYAYEQQKAENIVKHEKVRMEEQRALEGLRADALEKIEREKAEALDEVEQRKSAALATMQEERGNHEKELAQYRSQKSAIQAEVHLLQSKLEALKAESEVAVEVLRNEKLKEIDEMRIRKMQEVEDMRQARIADLEQAYFARIESLESARNEKFEAVRKAIEEAEQELENVKLERQKMYNEVKALTAEANRVKLENENLHKRAALDRQPKLEKMETKKLSGTETARKQKLQQTGRGERIQNNKNMHRKKK